MPGKNREGRGPVSGRDEGKGAGYGWVVVGAAFWVITLTSGSFYSYGVFFKPMLAEFGWDRGLTSGVMGVACLVYVALLPFVGRFADRHGPRLVMTASTLLLGLAYLLGARVRSALDLYLFIGVLGGLSYPGLLPVPVAVVSRWFDRRRGLALGIALAGVGVGTLVVPGLAALLIEAWGWRRAFAVLGLGVWISCVPPCLLVIRDPEGSGIAAAGPEETGDGASLGEALRRPAFWVLFVQYGLAMAVLGMVMIHIVPWLTDRGIAAPAAAGVLGAIGLGSVGGRLLAGVAVDRLGPRRVLAGCLGVMGLVLALLPGARAVAWAGGLGLCYGVSYGGFMVAVPSLTSWLFGLKAMGAIFSTISIAEGIGFGFGAWLAGALWDLTGGYGSMFRVALLLMLAAGGLSLLPRLGPAGRR